MMKQQQVWLTCFVIFHLFVKVSYQASPVLSIPTPVASMLETQNGQLTLGDPITCTDADGDPTRVYVNQIIPSYPCAKCFTLLPSADGTEYSVLYTRKRGRLHYSISPSYLLRVACTDEETTVTGVMDVRLLANNAPTFTTPTVPYSTDTLAKTQKKKAGDVIYDDIAATDDECDAVFYTLTSTPDTDNFEIGYADGKIYAAKDLRLMCEDSVRFTVSAQDTYNTPVNKVVIDMTLEDTNVKPVIANTETEVFVKETAKPDFGVLQLTVNDDTLFDDAKYKLRAVPERGLEYYYLNEQNGKWKIRTRTELDYEYELLRSVMLYVDVTDGFCDAQTYAVRVTIEDENEPPEIFPTKVEKCVYEGVIEIDPGWKVTDPDENEKLTWSTRTGPFFVDQDSGIFHSKDVFDIDPNKEKWTQFFPIEVTDKDGETAEGKLTVCILDANDNPPIFEENVYKVTASNCTKTGAILSTISATDEDSEFQGNNKLVYSGTGGNLIQVLAEGEVTLLRPCTPGESETIAGHVTDQGTYPGPLQGVATTIQFTCNVCPTPAPDTTTTTTTTTAVPGNDADFFDLNLFWTILAALMALMLLSLLTYVIWRYCVPSCRRRCSKPRPQRAPKPKKVQPKPAEKKPPPAPERKKDPPENIPPPPEPPTDNEPVLFPFWKETYGDRDQRHMPQRDVKPFTVEQDKEVEEKEAVEEEKEKEEWKAEREKEQENYRQQMEKYRERVNASRNPQPNPPPPPPKKKVCHIL